MNPPRVILVMGVAGSGKSTVGKMLAARNGGSFYDADDFHPPANIAKMAAGMPLDDADRAPWLSRLRTEVVAVPPSGQIVVLACSALKRAYRQTLGVGTAGVALVYLKVDAATLAKRLANRAGHFMKADMLTSQLAALEEPSSEAALTLGIDATALEIVIAIETALGLPLSP